MEQKQLSQEMDQALKLVGTTVEQAIASAPLAKMMEHQIRASFVLVQKEIVGLNATAPQAPQKEGGETG